ncbi:MAG: chromosome partitioning protein ParA [Psychromonas sp.]
MCNEKGGAGKSSIAQSLAVYLKLERNTDALLVDADPQRTTAEWAGEKAESDLPTILCVELTGNITTQLKTLANQYSSIIVDCGGADSKAMRSALTVANVALLPFRAKRRDLKVAPAMAEIIEMAKAINSNLKTYPVITQAPTMPNQSYRIQGAKTLLESLELSPLKNVTRNLNAWDDADEAGQSVLEWEYDKKAGDDAKNVFNELLEEIK